MYIEVKKNQDDNTQKISLLMYYKIIPLRGWDLYLFNYLI